MQLLETPRNKTSFRREGRNRPSRFALVGLIVVLLLTVIGTARANVNVDYESIGTGTLLFSSGAETLPAPTVASDVQMAISGLVARVLVRQTFRNVSDEWVDGLYLFPLPETAAVDHLRMRVGEREIVGEIRKRQAARRAYEKARESGRKASLVEQERPNMFTNSVANIGPGESVIVEIEYQQRVDYDDGTFSLRFPMAITPRYAPEPQDVALIRTSAASTEPAGWRPDNGPVFCAAGECATASISVSLDAGFALESVRSAYHEISSVNTGRGLDISLRAGRVAMDRDFELAWRASTGSEPGVAAFTETVDGERYALVMFMPPQITQGPSLARELILVLDRSGSMAGPSMRQARAALSKALERLTPRDRFNVIAFESEAQALFPQPEYADELALATARSFVDSIDANGGTNIHDALTLALGEGASERAVADGFLRQVVFITDGSVANEEQLLRMIDDRLGDSRLFTVGIGPAPNGYFMRKAAAFGRGSFTYVGEMTEVEEKMDGLLGKLERPALTDITVDWPAGVAADANPGRIPDLYAGEPVMVTARLSTANDHLAIRGGAGWQQRVALDGHHSPGIGTLYARERIAALMDQRLRASDRTAIEEQITTLALRHHLVSKFTSLVAVDKTPSRPAGIAASAASIPTPMPALALATMPVGATNAPAWILLGALFLIVPLFFVLGWRE